MSIRNVSSGWEGALQQLLQTVGVGEVPLGPEPPVKDGAVCGVALQEVVPFPAPHTPRTDLHGEGSLLYYRIGQNTLTPKGPTYSELLLIW